MAEGEDGGVEARGMGRDRETVIVHDDDLGIVAGRRVDIHL